MEFQITPIVTEKATMLTEKRNRYTFRVSPEANKFQIQDMVEKLYGYTVFVSLKVYHTVFAFVTTAKVTRGQVAFGVTSSA